MGEQKCPWCFKSIEEGKNNGKGMVELLVDEITLVKIHATCVASMIETLSFMKWMFFLGIPILILITFFLSRIVF